MSETLEKAVKQAKCQRDESRGNYFAPTLKELCCFRLGRSVPFELVQLHPQRVPEELQRRIAYWSFPSEPHSLLQYINLARNGFDYSQNHVTYFSLELDIGALEVENMVQIG